jgi:flagellar biosynthesis protein FlhB
MLTKVIKWTAIAALMGGFFGRSFPDLEVVLQFVVAAAAVVVLTQAATMRRYVWAALFLLAAFLFNPILPIPFSVYVSGLVRGLALFLFFFSLELLKPQPRLSIASITNRMPGSEAL